MRRATLFALVFGCLVTNAARTTAQTAYGSVGAGIGAAGNGFGDVYRITQAVGGVEVLIDAHVGLGGRIGVAAGGGDAVAPLSLNGTYYFGNESRGAGNVAYVSGGYTRMAWLTERIADNAYNVGSGVVLWGTGRSGLAIEVRDVIRPGSSVNVPGRTIDVSPTRHWVSINAIATFR